jgi:putative DNA primase/helicase
MKHPQTGEKWIRPMSCENGVYALKEPALKEAKPLYRLHELAQRREESVYLVEGEKCADALAALGLLATTSGGADSVAKVDWSPLAKRTVILWPDHDEAGLRYAREASAKLSALGCTVAVLDVASLGLPAKGDCVDWLKARPRATAQEVRALPLALPVANEDVETRVAGSPLARLAELEPLDYLQVRKAEAKRLGVSVQGLDALVKRQRKASANDDEEMFPTVTPSEEPVDAAALFDEIHEVIRTFIICEPETAIAATLWITFTWFIDHVKVAPLAVITAPEKRCGKSQLLSLIGALSRRPLTASNISPAALYRVIQAYAPTLLIDEVDTFLRDNEELRGVINSGHTRQTAFVVRTQGDEHKPKRFSTWGAKALSGIGTLADTLMDRAVVLTLRRKLPGEHVERLRHADDERFGRLASQLARLEQDAAEQIARARPPLPPELNDRAQDNWEPLLALADYAGGAWPKRAREAARKLSVTKESTASVSVELLADVYEVFETTGFDRISSAELLRHLNSDEMKRWASYHRGQPMTARQFAKRVGEFGVEPGLVRIGETVSRGYHRREFEDAFQRYLPPEALVGKSVTTLQSDEIAANQGAFFVTDASQRSVHEGAVTDDSLWGSGVTDRVTEEHWSFQSCNAVTDPREDEERKIVVVDL